MCVAIPGKVISIEEGLCIADFMGVSREVSIELLEGVNVGDYILVHAGYAVEKIKEEEAIETINLLEELKKVGQNLL